MLSEQAGQVDALAFQPGGDLLAAAYNRQLLVLWDLETGYPIHSTTLQEKVTSMAFTDTEQMCLAGPCTFAYWRFSQDKQPQSIFFLYRGLHNVVSANGKAHAHLSYPADNDYQSFLLVHQGPNMVGFPGNLFDLQESEVQYESLCLSGDGSKAGVSWWMRNHRHDWEPRYAVLDVTTQSIVEWDPISAKLYCLSRTGQYLAIRMEDEPLVIEDLVKDHHVIYPFSSNSMSVMGADFSPDEGLLACITGDRELIIVNLPDSEVVLSCQLVNEPSVVRFREDGEWLAVGDDLGNIYLYEIRKLLSK